MESIKCKNFNKSAALLSRLIARRYSSFRSQHGFKEMKKINVAICRLLEINIIDTIENLLSTLPEIIIDNKMNLPTREQFEYFLIRLETLSKLCERIIICSKVAFCIFLKFLHQAIYIDISTLIISVISQIYTYSKKLYYNIIKYYNLLISYQKSFVYNTHLLRDKYKLSIKLENLFKNETVDFIEKLPLTKRKLNDINFDIFDDDDEQEDKQLNEVNVQNEKNESQNTNSNNKSKLNIINVKDKIPVKTQELGTVISREKYLNQFIPVKDKKSKKIKLN